MTRFALSSTRATLIALGALAASSMPITSQAQAGWGGVSISIGDGYGSNIRIGRSCRYYYKKAVNTGDAYWWDRYYDCRAGY